MRLSVIGRASVLTAILVACSPVTPPPSPVPDVVPTPVAASPCGTDGGTLDLDCAAFPNTTAVKQPQWDYFAWNSFIAANWPAIDPQSYNEQRGIPNVTQSFTGATPTSLLTWETYKEKREVFFYPPGTQTNPGQWNQAPFYGPLFPTVPMCPGTQAKPGTTLPSGMPRRVFSQGGKVPFNSLDETVEVASEALETQAQLCSGVPNPMCGTATQADCCRVATRPVGPRVWKGQPADGQPVVYEVKVNYDFFQYVTASNNMFYLDPNAQAAATQGNINLPWRTSAAGGPPGGGNPGTPGYKASTAVATYSPQYVTPTSNVMPYLSGAVHLKAAWMMLKNEDRSRFHTTEAGYFREDLQGNKCMAIGTFGLVGLHIIQRIHQGSGSAANSLGGTFIFATWEHVDNDSAGFRYSNYFAGQPFMGPPKKGFYPALNYTLPVVRRYPILPGTANSNTLVHQAIANVNPGSVWLNYQLIGVQFQAVSSLPEASQIANHNDPTGMGQPVFLANSVIETNAGLQNFRGLPPTVVPIANYQPYIAKNTSLSFQRNTQNVTFSKQGYNMGGCMGCHGVAQTKGFSFSFVLLGGQRGADVDTQTQFTVPPAPPSN